MNLTPSSVPAAKPVLGVEVCLVDLRDCDGNLVRKISTGIADKLVKAGLGAPAGHHVKLFTGINPDRALGLARSSRTWTPQQRQRSRVKHNGQVCAGFGPCR